jgi:hypothetical protein
MLMHSFGRIHSLLDVEQVARALDRGPGPYFLERYRATVAAVGKRSLPAGGQPVGKLDETDMISERSIDTRLSARGNEREAVHGALL